MNNNNALQVKELTKIYSIKKNQNKTALNSLSLEVKKAEIFGLLGPNGAGKTTFINILGGTVLKTSGKVNVCGFDLDKNSRQVRACVGIVPQEIHLDPFFNPKKSLELQAGLYGVKKNERITETILKLISLENESNTYARNLSGGMKRRLLIGKAMVHTPPILVLDEPTAGVDVELRKKLWANILELNKLGVTIILTTHNLFEAETLCERIAILNHGKLLALDTTNNLIGRIEKKKVIFKIEKNNKFEDMRINNIEFKKIDDSNIEATFNKNKTKIEEIVNILKKKNLNLIDFTSKDADLEDVFIQLVNNG